MAEIPEERMEEIKEAYEIFCRTTEMELGFDQVGDVFRAINLNPTIEDVENALGNPSKEDMAAKKLKIEEFLPVYTKLVTEFTEGTYDDILEGLRVFDKEGNGTVMGAEIRHVLRTLGEKMTTQEISACMDGQEDMNGSINIDTFCRYLLEEKKAE
uniref:myosin light chain 3, skeletal muscle isoform n=1 Tax=Ciona intestinalis TaxID=7719 RepID=UPI0000522945|nr:myosin light chain 3, skeletal muscle isoform [Ciona intestinalis]XP_002128489.1 myosin light chain 3, skeletal muscle isoform-like [Ciona intestinalis]|eukprot:XP_002128245.1 myosin light chain 3, skeletal muscle isoform [Ciona intestinalis]